ncbi:carboxylesterase/lipase family protein [Allonocardiopsis opalescens]|uniref:Carboxylic ester hydrolase n=1 Tax=Allonocardiopsis opalescens TaxID=1144618 RepID=A0A2T0QF55_9ACTN|nr:carboxylesterase family protein [Allonocardiopsis opalescens]PRY02481.1 para-nitrobenzyl esterase [Allonocardiopsis opalescens]
MGTHRSRRRRRPALAAAVAAASVTLLAGAVVAPATALPGQEPGTVVATRDGRVRGTVHEDGTRTFYALPYAAPPVGELRWSAPEPAAAWPGTRDATAPGPACPQAQLPESVPSGEDCLHLNVTTPSRSAGSGPRPVLVWVHGGSFTSGRAAEFGARRMAERHGVVVVTVNYRLGALGLLSLPELAGSGTFGLADQQQALRWVRDNAAAFGGDPGRVTLFGESAGGVGVCAQLASPGAAGLFHRAVLQSGSCSTLSVSMVAGAQGLIVLPEPQRLLITAEDSREAGAQLAAAVGCERPTDAESLACLRELPAQTLVDAQAEGPAAPAYGTELLPVDPAEALRSGAFNRVPVITGHTRDEARLTGVVTEILVGPLTERRFAEQLDEVFGAQAGAVAARYPIADHGTPGLAWAALDTDRSFACPQLRDAGALAAHVPTYSYTFDDRTAPPYLPADFPYPPDFPMGASHAAELGYLFELDGRPDRLAPEQRELADTMTGYWTRFARTGEPNGHGRPRWPAFPGASQSLDTAPAGVGQVDAHQRHNCELWAEVD